MLLGAMEKVADSRTMTTGDTTPKHAGSVSSAPTAWLYVILDPERLHAGPSHFALPTGSDVILARRPDDSSQAQFASLKEVGAQRLLLPDRRASSRHARVAQRGENWFIEDLGSKNGTWIDGRLVQEPTLLRDGAIVEVGHTFLCFRSALPPWPAGAEAILASAAGLRTLRSDLACTFLDLAAFAATPGHVAILGETGTGKEVIAHAYHALTRRKGQIVAVNCGAIPQGLVESTLFGHKKGGFSGAAGDSLGLVRAAQGGTLFLDEIGDLPLVAQAALLRVIEAREVMPVGASQAVHVDVRFVCATHRDIPAMVARGEFRADLWARLSAFVLRLPPLRRRLEDFGLVIASAVERFAGPESKTPMKMQRDAARELLRRPWPLNIRELMNVMAQAINASKESGVIGLPQIPPPVIIERGEADLDAHAPAAAQVQALGHDEVAILDSQLRSRRAQLWILLDEHCGNVSEVARLLGRPRRVVHRWLKALALDPNTFRR
jgi:DNA-binding NtrC family response regulator